MRHDPDRRSFLARVAGGGLVAGAALILGAGSIAQRQTTRTGGRRRMIVDRDPRDPARLPSAPRPTPMPPSQPPSENMMAPVDTHPRITTAAPRQRFVICPGHRRCPRRLP